jgi:hypothetical protein
MTGSKWMVRWACHTIVECLVKLGIITNCDFATDGHRDIFVFVGGRNIFRKQSKNRKKSLITLRRSVGGRCMPSENMDAGDNKRVKLRMAVLCRPGHAQRHLHQTTHCKLSFGNFDFSSFEASARHSEVASELKEDMD